MEQQALVAENTLNADKPRVPALSFLGLSLNLLEDDGLDSAPNGFRIFGDLLQEREDDTKFTYDGTTYYAPAIVHVNRVQSLQSDVLHSHSVAELRENYAYRLGVKGAYGAFSTKAEANFSTAVHQRSETLIVTHEMTTNGWTLQLALGTNDHAKYLSPRFYEELNNKDVSPAAFFKTYGTHVATAVLGGGRVMASFASKSNTRATREKLAVTAEVRYGSVTVDGDMSRDREELLSQSEIEESWHITGGTEAAAMELRQLRTPAAYIKWAESVSRNPSFGSVTRIAPLWEFAADEDRRYELESYFMLHLTLRSLQEPQLFRQTGSDDGQRMRFAMTVPRHYKIISGGAKLSWARNGAGALLVSAYPQHQNSWYVSGKEHLTHDASAEIEACVFAVYDPYNFLEVHIEWSESKREGYHLVETVTLPDEGYLMTGGGAQIDFRGPGNMLTASCPVDTDPEGITWIAKSKDHGARSIARITAYAIGLRVRPAYTHLLKLSKNMISDTGNVDASSSMEITVKFDDGYTLAGGGAEVNWTGVGHMLTGTYPEGDKWIGTGKEHNFRSPANITVYAIGLKAELLEQ